MTHAFGWAVVAEHAPLPTIMADLNVLLINPAGRLACLACQPGSAERTHHAFARRDASWIGRPMWKGLKKALGKPGKSKKGSSSFDRFGLDVSTRSTSSAAPSSVLFPLDLADADALAAWSEQNVEQEQQLPSLGRRAGTAAAGPDPLTASQLQQQLQQQLVVQQLVQRTDDHSAGKRQAAALQKRIDNQMLNPSTCLYQISSLLSLSTLFEHKVSSRLAAWLDVAASVMATTTA